jgi:hypothetical protein
MMLLYLVPKIPQILRGERRQNTIVALERNPQIPHMRDLKGSYEGISEFYFENLAKL